MALDEEDVTADALDADHRTLLDQYVKAFENADMDTLLRLLRDEVRLEMPPQPAWFSGRDHVTRFFARQVLTTPGVMRLLPTTANGGRPAMATYWRQSDGSFHADALQVLTLRGYQVASISAFRDPSLFPLFGLPVRLPADAPRAPSWSASRS